MIWSWGWQLSRDFLPRICTIHANPPNPLIIVFARRPSMALFSRCSGGNRFGDPFQISGRSAFDGQADAFRDVVGMEFRNGAADLAEGRGSCLHDQEPFASFLDVTLPAVDGRDLWDDVDAGGCAAVYESAGDLAGFFLRAGGGEDDSFVGHIESGGSDQLSVVSQPLTSERVALRASV